MKLQPALIFGQNMILQRGIPIPVWGRSVRDDTVTVVLNGYTLHTQAKRGEWRVTFQPMEAVEDTSMTIASAATGERIEFGGVAIGEVWIAGGQSNMEFLLKYDEGADEMHNIPQDPMLRYFRYPQTSFLGSWSGTHSRMTASGGSGTAWRTGIISAHRRPIWGTGCGRCLASRWAL